MGGAGAGPEHNQARLDEAFEERPIAKLIARVLLQLPPAEGYPLGRPTRRRSVRFRAELKRQHQRKKVAAKLPTLAWDKEGSKWRAKKKLFRIHTGIMYYVHTRRFHTQGDHLQQVDLTDGSRLGDGLGGDGAGGGADGGFVGYDDDSYNAAWDAMVEETNEDPELAVLNHLLFDLLTPFALDEKAKSHGLTQVQHEMRKFWLPWLQQGGKGHFHVISHMVRQILSHYSRSERRAVMAFMKSAPNLGGGFGKNVEMDAIHAGALCATGEVLPEGAGQRLAPQRPDTGGGQPAPAAFCHPGARPALGRARGVGAARLEPAQPGRGGRLDPPARPPRRVLLPDR